MHLDNVYITTENPRCLLLKHYHLHPALLSLYWMLSWNIHLLLISILQLLCWCIYWISMMKSRNFLYSQIYFKVSFLFVYSISLIYFCIFIYKLFITYIKCTGISLLPCMVQHLVLLTLSKVSILSIKIVCILILYSGVFCNLELDKNIDNQDLLFLKPAYL